MTKDGIANIIRYYDDQPEVAADAIFDLHSHELAARLPDREGWQPKDGVQEAVEAVKLYAKWALGTHCDPYDEQGREVHEAILKAARTLEQNPPKSGKLES